MLIGVHDDGRLNGLQVTDEFLHPLGGIRSEGNILPQPLMTVAKYALKDGDVAVITVKPSDLPPVRYKGRVHIRIVPRKAIANEQEERILSERRVALVKSFDALPARGGGIEDVALRQFEVYRHEVIDTETINTNHRSIEQQLASLRLYDSVRGNPTHAGILLFGKTQDFSCQGLTSNI